jgi:ketosteroid isomerase-like protein
VDSRALLEALYDAWNRGDMTAFETYFGPEFTYETSGMFPGFESVYRGADGMRRFYETMLEAWESFRIELVELVEEDGIAIAGLGFHARGRTSGVEVDLEFAHGFVLEGDRIVSLVSRESIDDARRRVAELKGSASTD